MVFSIGNSDVSALEYYDLVQPIGNPYRGTLKYLESQGDQGPLLTPAQANSLMAQRGYTQPPWDSGTQVTLYTNTTTLYYARFFTPPGSNQYGSWVMRAATVRGLTAAQIKDAFALQYAPTGVSYAVIPAGHVLWTGTAAPISGWGGGGGEQTFIDDSRANPQITYYWKNLSGGALLYAPVANAGNAGRTAAYLDGIIPTNYQDRLTAGAYSSLDPYLGPLDVLGFTDFNGFNAALNQIGPERYDSLTRAGMRNDLLFGRAVSRRSQASVDPGASNPANGTSSEATGTSSPDKDIDSIKRAQSGVFNSRFDTRGIKFWATGVGEFGRQAGFGEHTGFDYYIGGAVLGADLLTVDNFTFGFTAGYLRTNLDWINNGGDASIDSPKFGVYFDYADTAGFFAKGLLSGGYEKISATRTISYPGVGQRADANTSGLDMMAQFSGGYEFRIREWSVSPVAELTWLYLHQDGFSESGADSLDLRVRSRGDQTFRSQLGLRVERPFTVGGDVPVTPSVEVGWAHETPLNGRSITASLVNQPGTFSVNGVTGDSENLVVDAGIKAKLNKNTHVFTRYEAETGDHFTAHQVGVGLTYAF